MEAVLRKHFLRIFVLCVLLLAAGPTFFFSARLDIPSGLLKRSGSVGYFSDNEDGGMSIILQRAGKDAWGFFEWPKMGIYGMFSGSGAEKGHFKVGIRQGNSICATLVIPAGHMGNTLAMRIERGREKAIATLLKRRGNFPVSKVELYYGAFTAEGKIVPPLRRLAEQSSIEDSGRNPGQSGYYLDALQGKGRSASFLDLSLRRGSSSLNYARGYWSRFGQTVAEAVGTNVSARAFVERQYLVFATDSLFVTATERYVFDGGAHGTTTAIFDIADEKSRKSLSPSDIFNEGWREAIAGKLEKEALRLFSAGESLGRDRKLSEFGLFEDKIKPSTGLFLCRSGVGFHYDRYELAPYVSGDFMFVIPWNELKDVLKNPNLGESFK